MFLIEPGLYQGARLSKVYVMPAEITAIVCLESAADVPSLHEDLTKIQIHLPIYDMDYPGHVWLNTAVRIVETLRHAGYIVYIHCRGGVSRSIMLTAAFLMKKHHWSVDDAMNFIALANPSLNPNPRFLRGLAMWKTTL